MGKSTYDNTVHFDEHHYSPRIAAAFADRFANEAAEKSLRADHKRVALRIDTTNDGGERAKLALELERIDREIKRVCTNRTDIERIIEEARA